MLTKSCLFLFLLTAFQVSARYKVLEPTNFEDEINPEHTAVSSSSLRLGSGWDAQPGQFPYHAALRTVSTPGGTIWRCGGAIVAQEWVITNGQCTRGLGSVTVRVGLSFNNPDAIYPGKEWYSHPDFNDFLWGNQLNDIALVKTTRPIVFSNLVKPIRIQSTADAYRNYDGEQVYLSGHGRTGPQGVGYVPDNLRWVYLRAISNSECAKIFPNGLVVNTTVCATYYNITTQSPCNGDAGGPLVHDGADGVPTLIGVWTFTWGSTSCQSGSATGYTRPGPYLPWFKEVTGIDFDTLQGEETTTTTPTTTTSPTTTTTTPTTTTESIEQTPDGTTPEDDATAPPEGSGEGDDSDSSESDTDDDMTQLMKRLLVLVKVKVRMDQYNSTNAVGMESNHYKH